LKQKICADGDVEGKKKHAIKSRVSGGAAAL